MIDRRQLLLSTLAAGAAAAPLRAFALEGEGVSDPRLAKLLDAFVEEILAELPETATGIGKDKGPRAGLKRRLDDLSAGARAKAVAAYADRAKRLKAIPRASLKGRDLTTYDTVLFSQEVGAEGGRFAYGLDFANPYVVSQQDGTVANVGEFLNAQHLIETRDDAEAYIARLDQVASRLDQESDRIKDAAGKGVVLPDFLLATALTQVADLRAPAPARRG